MEQKGLQTRITTFGKDEQGEIYFYVEGDPFPFKLDIGMVNLSLVPYMAKGLGVTMNYTSTAVSWWTFVQSPLNDAQGHPVPWLSRRIRYRKMTLPLRKH
ncbi:hypothetical protein HL669_21895 (plasmid) [Vibrio parahaemolyticus]|uniref:hypothetical protein n=1 Tax=Vibrio parahaemolyticus TaxID=670 RepID=UPI001485B52C|nr:hypothetical protein [Vibrio parahaemolyticus]NNU14267.1 hypothetical protein [Vibrio parahaemolyticus]